AHASACATIALMPTATKSAAKQSGHFGTNALLANRPKSPSMRSTDLACLGELVSILHPRHRVREGTLVAAVRDEIEQLIRRHPRGRRERAAAHRHGLRRSLAL